MIHSIHPFWLFCHAFINSVATSLFHSNPTTTTTIATSTTNKIANNNTRIQFKNPQQLRISLVFSSQSVSTHSFLPVVTHMNSTATKATNIRRLKKKKKNIYQIKYLLLVTSYIGNCSCCCSVWFSLSWASGVYQFWTLSRSYTSNVPTTHTHTLQCQIIISIAKRIKFLISRMLKIIQT